MHIYKTRTMVGTIEKGVIQMIEVMMTGAAFTAMAYAENKGWVDKEKARLVLTLGMTLGTGVSLFYFLHMLSIWFL